EDVRRRPKAATGRSTPSPSSSAETSGVLDCSMSVKRLLIGTLVLAACSLPALCGAAITASVPKAKLRGFVCKTARDPATREVAITAVMRPLPHTVKMALRIDLLERKRRTGPATSLRYGELGSWISPADKTLGQRPGDIWI